VQQAGQICTPVTPAGSVSRAFAPCATKQYGCIRMRPHSSDAHGQRQSCVRAERNRAVWLRQVSGKNWKAPAPRMSATGTAKLKTSWDKKMAAKAEAALFREQKQEARADHNAKLTVSPGLCVLAHGTFRIKASVGAEAFTHLSSKDVVLDQPELHVCPIA
jgi:hypothetical protein